ncbi:hypothetical protein Ancab_040442 [Ancistrocladus abbreviatus]
MKSDRKPPVVKSPMRLQARRVLRSDSTPMRTPDIKEVEIRPEYRTISCELKALAKMAEEQFGTNGGSNNNAGLGGANTASYLFERGRFYDEYSARRNERLKRKKLSEEDGGAGLEPKTLYSLGVKVESSKRKDSKKQLESLKKSVSATYALDRSEHPRYALRSIKKPPLPVPMSNVEKSAGGERKTRAQRASRRY